MSVAVVLARHSGLDARRSRRGVRRLGVFVLLWWSGGGVGAGCVVVCGGERRACLGESFDEVRAERGCSSLDVKVAGFAREYVGEVERSDALDDPCESRRGGADAGGEVPVVNRELLSVWGSDAARLDHVTQAAVPANGTTYRRQ